MENSVIKRDENCDEKCDTIDAFGFLSKPRDDNTVKMVVDKDALFYNLDHRFRGVAVIFNHENFLIPHLGKRTGTSADVENLKQCLRALDFEVMVFEDLGVKILEEKLNHVAKMDHSDYDCFMMCVLTHGEKGILFARDCGYSPESLWKPFASDNCKTLAGKPKIFFVQACQGDQLDGGITVRTQIDSSSSYKLPIHADFLIAYSTIPGFYSWRNTTKGSWFIQSLCAELRENMYKYDILTILTFVNRRVAIDFESNVPQNLKMHAQKQIPCITYMLTRLLKFRPKNER